MHPRFLLPLLLCTLLATTACSADAPAQPPQPAPAAEPVPAPPEWLADLEQLYDGKLRVDGLESRTFSPEQWWQVATPLLADGSGFTVEETLVAGTANAADALGQPTWGRLEPGSAPDYLVVDGPEALLPLYSWGHSQLYEMVIGGRSVWRKDG